MKKINFTNDEYSIAKNENNKIVVRVDYLFKGNETVKYFSYDAVEGKETDYYVDLARHDYKEFRKSKKGVLYSYRYLYIENTSLKRRRVIGCLQILLLIAIITSIVLIIVFTR